MMKLCRKGLSVVLLGIIAAVGVKNIRAQSEFEADVPAAVESVAKARNLAVEWSKVMRFNDEETVNAVAESIYASRSNSLEICKAIKSIKLVPLPVRDNRGAGKKVVRVLYSDGNVKFYDGKSLDGSASLENEPSEENVNGTREYFTHDVAKWWQLKLGLHPIPNEDAQLTDDVLRAKRQVNISRNLAVRWIRGQQNALKHDGKNLEILVPLETLACFIVETKEKYDFANAMVKSIKIVPLSADKSMPERKAIRVQYADESVKYYDDWFLAGQTEPLTTPSDVVVDATPEHLEDLDAFYENYMKLIQEPSQTGAIAGPKPPKPSVGPLLLTKAQAEAKFLTKESVSYIEYAQKKQYDSTTTALYIAAFINFKRKEIQRKVGVNSGHSLTEIKSVKIVPFCIVESVENENFVRATVRYAVRVVYSDGTLKYYGDNVCNALDDLKFVPGYAPIVASEESLPEFELELGGFNRLLKNRKIQTADEKTGEARQTEATK